MNKELARTLKFIGFSISAGVIEVLVFTLMNEIIMLPYWPCYLVALMCSVLWNFTFIRKFTFKSAANVPRAMLLVLAYYAVFTPLSTIGGNALEGSGWNEYIVLGITMLVNMSTEFLYDRFVVFRDSIDTNKFAEKEKEKISKTRE